MLAEKLAGSGVADKLYVDDVFSTYLYTGNGSTQTINNGIDLSGKGGLVWVKSRGPNAYLHNLYDTPRGTSAGYLCTNGTDAQTGSTGGVTAFNSDGFSLQAVNAANASGESIVSWTFRKAPKFFDVVTYTGNGVAGRQIPHGLGIAPGMIVVKRTDSVGDWLVWHRSETGDYACLNSTQAFNPDGGAIWGDGGTHIAPTASVFTVNNYPVATYGNLNAYGAQYVAYLFAHDPSADGIIQCGSFTTDGSGNATVNLGWEPQYLMVKRSNVVGGWFTFDTFRDWSRTMSNFFTANTSEAEVVYANTDTYPTATGFVTGRNVTNASSTIVYLAIRRPNKPPTSGTQVYNAIARTGTGTATTITGVGFAPDMSISKSRAPAVGWGSIIYDKLRGVTATGNNFLNVANNSAEETRWPGDQLRSLDIDGFTVGPDTNIARATNGNGYTYINHIFRRAPGFFDVVCYTGTGVARTVNHNLGVVPELMIVKRRNYGSTYGWAVFHKDISGYLALLLQSTGTGNSELGWWFNTPPTSSVFTVGDRGDVNGSGDSLVAYLFASLPGVSKVGSYTGNGTSQTINAGFTTGARFVLIKRTDSTGDWYIWDTARGIVAANDPHLSLNTTDAEVTTDDSVDPDNSGFVVNQVAATNINVTSASYIFLAIA